MPVHPYLGNIEAASVGQPPCSIGSGLTLYTITVERERETEREGEKERQRERERGRERKGERKEDK